MAEIPVDKGDGERSRASVSTVEVEREITKRRLIESVSSILLVLLYMAFSLIRDREPGVVALDGTGDDWDES